MMFEIPPQDLAKYDQSLAAHQMAINVLVEHYRAISLLFGDPAATVSLCQYLEEGGLSTENLAGLLGTAVRQLGMSQ